MAFRPGVPYWNRPAIITGAKALRWRPPPIAALKGRSSTGFFHGIIRGRVFPWRIPAVAEAELIWWGLNRHDWKSRPSRLLPVLATRDSLARVLDHTSAHAQTRLQVFAVTAAQADSRATLQQDLVFAVWTEL